MKILEENNVHLSVRDLVEFVHKSGDIYPGQGAPTASDAMLEGANAHRRIQRSQGKEYQSEVPLKITVPCSDTVFLTVDGRADGIITGEDGSYTIDEIKGQYLDISSFTEPLKVHLAQALVYAYIYAQQESLLNINVRITYVQLEVEDGVRRKSAKHDAEIRYFHYSYTFEEVADIFQSYVEYYRKWAIFIVQHRIERRESADGFPFPYEYRPGQREIVRQAYRTMLSGKRLFVQAPTGIGKTLATLYPAVQAVGQKLGEKIFYLTAKTVTATVAEEGMKMMADRGLCFTFTKITAKEKMCPLEKMQCDPINCPRAKGHFDRVNEAVYDLITNEKSVSSKVISEYAEKHCVCPYEYSLDVSLYTDVIICDYNYAFDPHVYLHRYFSSGSGDYIFLIDEAHNLVDRARDMYSAILVKEDVLAAKKYFENQKTILKYIEKVNKTLLSLKRECENVTVFTEDTFPNALLFDLQNLKEAILRYMDRNPNHPYPDEVLEFFFVVSDFLMTAEYTEKGYVSYASFDEEKHFFVKLFCINPADRLKERLDNINSTVFFSATFLPINYYKELLLGDKEEDAMYVDSPFDPEKRALLLSRDVSSKYTRRGYEEYRRIGHYVMKLASARKGNYLVFLPSHKFLEEVKLVLEEELLREEEKANELGDRYVPPFELLSQKRVMSEEDRKEFLSAFEDPHTDSRQSALIGLSVMGGVFSEGIDLKREALIGVAVVGTGLPQVCVERELIKDYYAENGENGFDFAYRFPGFNKVMQAAGRLIRTTEDEGVILLLDERFLYRENLRLFPKEWQNFKEISEESAERLIKGFWDYRGRGEFDV